MGAFITRFRAILPPPSGAGGDDAGADNPIEPRLGLSPRCGEGKTMLTRALTSKPMIAILLTLVLAVPGLALAVSQGRLIGKVVDEKGEPVEGVVVTATAASLPSYVDHDTTDKRGVFKFDFPELDQTYRLHFEKIGYASFETEITWDLAGTAHKEYTMHPGSMVEAGSGPVASTSSQAIAAYNAGLAALNAKDYATAEAKFQEAVKHDPKLRQAWAALSAAYFEDGRYQDTVDAAAKAIALGSTNDAMLRARWQAYEKLGDKDKAASALDDMKNTALRTEEAKELYNQGVGLFKSGDKEGALAKFQDAANLDPTLMDAQEGVATTAQELGHNEQAAAAAEQILTEDPENAQALRIRYNAYLALGDDDKLVDALVGLAAVNPDVARQGLLKLAYDAYDANDMPKAQERFEKVLQVFPDQPDAHYVLALIEVNQGEKEQAIANLERYLQLAPNADEADTARQLLDYLKNQKTQ